MNHFLTSTKEALRICVNGFLFLETLQRLLYFFLSFFADWPCSLNHIRCSQNKTSSSCSYSVMREGMHKSRLHYLGRRSIEGALRDCIKNWEMSSSLATWGGHFGLAVRYCRRFTAHSNTMCHQKIVKHLGWVKVENACSNVLRNNWMALASTVSTPHGHRIDRSVPTHLLLPLSFQK